MPSFKNRISKSLSATDTNWNISGAGKDGWLANITFIFDSNVSGDVAIQLKPYGASNYDTIAYQTISSDAVAVWMGNQHLTGDDNLRIVKDIATACTVYITIDYQNMGDGSWQTFAKGEAEHSSSSSSSSVEYSSSSSSRDSSSSSSSSSSEAESSSSSSSSSA